MVQAGPSIKVKPYLKNNIKRHGGMVQLQSTGLARARPQSVFIQTSFEDCKLWGRREVAQSIHI
jgi:hypothetical protein